MTRDKTHHSNKKYGGYHGDMPPQRHQPKPVVSAANEQATQQMAAIVYLGRRLGGKWSFNAQDHTFSADFDPKVAVGLKGFMAPYQVTAKVTELTATGKARLSLSAGDYAALHTALPAANPVHSVADEFQKLIRDTQRETRGR